MTMSTHRVITEVRSGIRYLRGSVVPVQAARQQRLCVCRGAIGAVYIVTAVEQATGEPETHGSEADHADDIRASHWCASETMSMV